jgi:hypothetical protein
MEIISRSKTISSKAISWVSVNLASQLIIFIDIYLLIKNRSFWITAKIIWIIELISFKILIRYFKFLIYI